MAVCFLLNLHMKQQLRHYHTNIFVRLGILVHMVRCGVGKEPAGPVLWSCMALLWQKVLEYWCKDGGCRTI